MKTKKEWRIFGIYNFEKEEAYLRKKHQEGWRFLRTDGFGFYYFEECQPEDVIYRIDYQNTSITQDYVQLFADCGWYYVFGKNGCHYFCIPANLVHEDIDDSIFSDDESRLEMVNKVLKKVSLKLGSSLLFMLYWFYFGGFSFQNIIMRKASDIIFYIDFMISMIVWMNTARKYLSLKNKITDESTVYFIRKICLIVFTIIFTIVGTWGYIRTIKGVKENCITDYYEETSFYKMDMEYFDRTITRSLELKKGDTITVSVDLDDGYISLNMFNPSKDKIFYSTFGSNEPWSEVVYVVDEDGEYDFTVKATDAVGKWAVEANK